jgi:hypothetical protein
MYTVRYYISCMRVTKNGRHHIAEKWLKTTEKIEIKRGINKPNSM